MATYKTKHKRKPAATIGQPSTLLKHFFVEELYIYGSQRHGVLKGDTFYTEAEYSLYLAEYNSDSLFPAQRNLTSLTQNGNTNYACGTFEFWSGHKQYELSNHLGNVLVTIQDRKWGLQTATPAVASKADYYLAYVVTVSDYYAFSAHSWFLWNKSLGMANPGCSVAKHRDGSSIQQRTASFEATYKYGFNNQEKEGELGEYYSFEFRVHDARLGRFLSVDSLGSEFPFNSPYVFASNNPTTLNRFIRISSV